MLSMQNRSGLGRLGHASERLLGPSPLLGVGRHGRAEGMGAHHPPHSPGQPPSPSTCATVLLFACATVLSVAFTTRVDVLLCCSLPAPLLIRPFTLLDHTTHRRPHHKPRPQRGAHQLRLHPASATVVSAPSPSPTTPHTAGRITSLAFNEEHIISGCTQAVVKVWEMNDLKAKRTLRGHEGAITGGCSCAHKWGGGSNHTRPCWQGG